MRYDNAQERLTPQGRELGMVTDEQWNAFLDSKKRIAQAVHVLSENAPSLEIANAILADSGQAPISEKQRWIQLLRRPGVNVERLFQESGQDQILSRSERLAIVAEEMYRGFYERQARDIDQQKRLEGLRIAANFDYAQITALSFESRLKLQKFRPLTIGQAARIPGVRPADITVLIYWMNQK